MPSKKKIQINEKVPLKLTAAERKLVLDELMCLDQDIERTIKDTPIGKSVMMSLDDLDDFGGYIAAEANHSEDKKKQKKLEALFEKIQDVVEKYTDEAPPQTFKIEDARREKAAIDQIVDFVAEAFVAAKQLRIKTKPLEHFCLAPSQREILLLIPGLSKAVKNKLAQEKPLTVSEGGRVMLAVADEVPKCDTQKQVALLLVAKHLMGRLEDGIAMKAEAKLPGNPRRTTKVKSGVLYQFKITLLGIKPPIWRRIQIQDCTLDKLHEHIQTSMGWTNSHLHQFEIQGERYGDPELMDGLDCDDSTKTRVSDILPINGKRFAFKYDYDFGDGWEHEILFEGSPSLEKGKKYPLCLEGKRACPPEDIGGAWGYADFLEAMADSTHERHEEFMEWNGPFDPDNFDPKTVTEEMRIGLPNWRNG